MREIMRKIEENEGLEIVKIEGIDVWKIEK